MFAVVVLVVLNVWRARPETSVPIPRARPYTPRERGYWGGASCRQLGRVSTGWVGPWFTILKPLPALLTHVEGALRLQLTVLVVDLRRSVLLIVRILKLAS